MSTFLRIVWDGDVPGLEERRLSLAHFERALRELLSAIRRIGSDLERDAWPTRDVSYAGRLTREASNIDVQLVSVTGNSPVTVEFAVVDLKPPQQRRLIEALGDRAVDRFLHDLRMEAAGTAAHHRVRSFLRALPDGLSRQQYVQTRSDGTTQQVELGAVRVPESPESPHLVDVIGEIVGVGFEPGRNEVKLKAFTGETITMSATPEQVDAAIQTRGAEIAVLGVVQGSRIRLLRLGAGRQLSADERLAHVFGTWNSVLARLAQ